MENCLQFLQCWVCGKESLEKPEPHDGSPRAGKVKPKGNFRSNAKIFAIVMAALISPRIQRLEF
ncbi:MAG: hypothetical protein GY804_03405 [Alphaproteobacteria bacterium]|nr:hypothetical protein [Alphaproteobacteria bacterium]